MSAQKHIHIGGGDLGEGLGCFFILLGLCAVALTILYLHNHWSH